MGRSEEAHTDFMKAETLLLPDHDVDIEKELALFHQNKGNHSKAVEHFLCCEALMLVTPDLDEDLARFTWNGLGISYNNLGEPGKAIEIYTKALEMIPRFKEAHVNVGQSYKDLGNLEAALSHFNQGLELDSNCVLTLNLKGLAEHNSGHVQEAYETYKKAHHLDPCNEDSGYMYGVCAHGLGLFREAVTVYDHVLRNNPSHFVFYVREVTLFQHHNLDVPLSTYNLDHSFDEGFKEAWTKRLKPQDIETNYTRQDPLFNINVPDVDCNVDLSHKQKQILEMSKVFGHRLQYTCKGFLRNVKQHRFAGLTILDMAQTVKKVWKAMNCDKLDGATLTGTYSSGCRSVHTFGWRDFFDIAVRWRQMSEPLDSVWWIDLLQRESFTEGFGSQTPMILGESKVTRYYPYYSKAFSVMKELLIQQNNLIGTRATQLRECRDCHELYHSCMGHDFYAITPCPSKVCPGRIMEGTRLTVQKNQKGPGYTFCIRTPCSPERWALFDEEMCHTWSCICDVVNSYQFNMETFAKKISHFAYYWYNFMPLTRGSAACGFITIHTLLLAVGYEIIQPPPQGIQWDWEAILAPSAEHFWQIIKPWLLGNLQVTQNDIVDSLPSVKDSFTTIRHMIHVLNHRLPEDLNTDS